MLEIIIVITLLHSTVSEMVFSMYSNDSKILQETKSTEEDEVHFHLFTYKNKNTGQALKVNDLNCFLKSNFNFNYSTKFIIHGWLSSNETIVALDSLRSAYVENTTFNVIVADWTTLATGQYKSAHRFVNFVSDNIIEFLKFLFSIGVKTTNVHIIGHCIGAHIAGRAGKYFSKEENIYIDAITGLDPAFPKFKFCSEDERLTKYDARFVEVIHTNGGYWGIREEIGHVDFMPNGGSIQPGCMHDKTGICAHERAIWYYAYSILNTIPFVAERYWRDENYKVHYSGSVDLILSGIHFDHGTYSQKPFVIDSKKMSKTTIVKRKARYEEFDFDDI